MRTCFEECKTMIIDNNSFCIEELCYCADGWTGRGKYMLYNGCHINLQFGLILDSITLAMVILVLGQCLRRATKWLFPLFVRENRQKIKHNYLPSDLYFGIFPAISLLNILYLTFGICNMIQSTAFIFGGNWYNGGVILRIAHIGGFASFYASTFVQGDIFFKVLPHIENFSINFTQFATIGTVACFVGFTLCEFSYSIYMAIIGATISPNNQDRGWEVVWVMSFIPLIVAIVSIDFNAYRIVRALSGIVDKDEELKLTEKRLRMFVAVALSLALQVILLYVVTIFTFMRAYHYIVNPMMVQSGLIWIMISSHFHRNINLLGINVNRSNTSVLLCCSKKTKQSSIAPMRGRVVVKQHHKSHNKQISSTGMKASTITNAVKVPTVES